MMNDNETLCCDVPREREFQDRGLDVCVRSNTAVVQVTMGLATYDWFMQRISAVSLRSYPLRPADSTIASLHDRT